MRSIIQAWGQYKSMAWKLTLFAVTEYMAIDHSGLTAPGESWKAIEEGRIADGDFPINPSGGLIGLDTRWEQRVFEWHLIALSRFLGRLATIR